MSKQSVENTDVRSRAKATRRSFIKEANDLLLYENYRLGNNVSCEDVDLDSILLEIDYINNCELINYINERVIEGPDKCLKINLNNI